MLVAVTTVHNNAEHGRAIDTLDGSLELLLFAHAFTSYKQNSIRQLHPERRVRQRKDGRRIDNNPIEERFQLFQQRLQTACLHDFDWVLGSHTRRNKPESGTLELIHNLR